MRIEIWSDVICPWCYIGKRRFEMALENFVHRDSVEVIWRSFELDVDAPRQYPGTRDEMLAQKYDVTLEDAAEMSARVTAAAKEVGLDYHLAESYPGNTFDAHRLLHFAAGKQSGEGATERIMQAYFSESLAVGDRAALVDIAPELGVSAEEARAVLESGEYADAVRADEARAAELGVSGVPFFVFDGKFGLSGAQPVEVFNKALEQAWTASGQ